MISSSRSTLSRFLILYAALYAGFGVQSPYLPTLLDNRHLRPETIALVPPGSRLTPRLNQLDLGVRKVFRIHEKFTLMGEAQFFNVTNSNAVLTESYTLGSSIKPYVAGGPGGVPTAILNPRMVRLNLQCKF